MSDKELNMVDEIDDDMSDETGGGLMFRRILGLIFVIVSIVATVWLAMVLHKYPLLPAKYIALIHIVQGLLILLSFVFLVSLAKKIGVYVFGILLTVLDIIISFAGVFYMQHGLEALENITGKVEQSYTMNVYVKADDANANTILDTKDYSYKVLENIDIDNTNKAIAKIEDEIGGTINVSSEQSAVPLVKSLLDGNCQAIIINAAYMDLFDELEGYENLSNQVKLVASYECVTYVEAPKQNSNNSSDSNVAIGNSNNDSNAKKESWNGTDPFIVYISGIDAWGHISQASRSDVNILAVINPSTKQILLVSTPRDYYVPLSISNGICDKLTHAGIYGVNVSVETLEMLYGVSVDHYFKVNFSGFEGLIDAMGGITVYSDYDFTVNPVKHYVVGENQLTGLEALAFARERYAFSGGDRQRGKNQMAVIEAVIKKMSSSSLLVHYTDIMKETEGTFATDMSVDEIALLVRKQLDDGGSWKVSSYSVTGGDASELTYSLSEYAYVMIPDQSTVDKAKEYIQKVLNGEEVIVE